MKILDQAREIRKRKGLSQADAGRRVGWSGAMVSHCEQAKGALTLGTLRQYLRAIGCRLEGFVVDEETGAEERVEL